MYYSFLSLARVFRGDLLRERSEQPSRAHDPRDVAVGRHRQQDNVDHHASGGQRVLLEEQEQDQ